MKPPKVAEDLCFCWFCKRAVKSSYHHSRTKTHIRTKQELLDSFYVRLPEDLVQYIKRFSRDAFPHKTFTTYLRFVAFSASLPSSKGAVSSSSAC